MIIILSKQGEANENMNSLQTRVEKTNGHECFDSSLSLYRSQ